MSCGIQPASEGGEAKDGKEDGLGPFTMPPSKDKANRKALHTLVKSHFPVRGRAVAIMVERRNSSYRMDGGGGVGGVDGVGVGGVDVDGIGGWRGSAVALFFSTLLSTLPASLSNPHTYGNPRTHVLPSTPLYPAPSPILFQKLHTLGWIKVQRRGQITLGVRTFLELPQYVQTEHLYNIQCSEIFTLINDKFHTET